MTDAEIIAELFGCPCNYTPIDEEMCVNCDCEHLCGTSEQTDAKCREAGQGSIGRLLDKIFGNITL